MAEKADLPTDTVSLPPTYAPSETFTDSPPPAYRRPGMAAVRIAKLVCCTLLAMTFIVGFFVITHKWIQSRDCNCQMTGFDSIQTAALLGAPIHRLDNNRIEEDITFKDVETAMDDDADDDEDDTEEVVLPNEQIVIEPEEKEENVAPLPLEEKFEELAKDLKLPKGLLLGNPKMAGKDVHCKVEKRQQKIAEGIMTQAIIVTCDDDDEEEEEEETNKLFPFPGERPKAPLSLLSSIMKILSTRPRSRDNDFKNEPRIIPIKSGPFPGPMGPFPGPMGPFPSTMGPFPGPMRIRPMRPPFPGQVSPFMVPLRNMPMPRPFLRPEENNGLPIILQRPPPEIIEGRSPRMNALPPIRVMNRPRESILRRLPFPMQSNNFPIKIVRIPHPPPMENFGNEQEIGPNDINDEQNDELPAPFRTLLNLLPAPRKIIRFRSMPSSEDEQREPERVPFTLKDLPFSYPLEPPMPHPMPEASGRALPAPVALPNLRVVRLPIMPQSRIIPEQNLMTHMEVRAPEEEQDEEQHFEEPQPMSRQPFALGNQEEDNIEFGPPKVHTLINQESSQLPEEQPQGPIEANPLEQDPIIRFQSRPQFMAQSAPSFAPEGRISEFAKLNSDAEVVPINEEPAQSQTPVHRVIIN